MGTNLLQQLSRRRARVEVMGGAVAVAVPSALLLLRKKFADAPRAVALRGDSSDVAAVMPAGGGGGLWHWPLGLEHKRSRVWR